MEQELGVGGQVCSEQRGAVPSPFHQLVQSREDMLKPSAQKVGTVSTGTQELTVTN